MAIGFAWLLIAYDHNWLLSIEWLKLSTNFSHIKCHAHHTCTRLFFSLLFSCNQIFFCQRKSLFICFVFVSIFLRHSKKKEQRENCYAHRKLWMVNCDACHITIVIDMKKKKCQMHCISFCSKFKGFEYLCNLMISLLFPMHTLICANEISTTKKHIVPGIESIRYYISDFLVEHKKGKLLNSLFKCC